MKLSEWKGPWPVLCRIGKRMDGFSFQDPSYIGGLYVVDQNNCCLEHSINSNHVGKIDDNPYPIDHIEVVDWFEPAAQMSETPRWLVENIMINAQGHIVKRLGTQAGAVCSLISEQSPTMNSCAEPSCLCQSPQLHDDACAWMAWRRGK